MGYLGSTHLASWKKQVHDSVSIRCVRGDEDTPFERTQDSIIGQPIVQPEESLAVAAAATFRTLPMSPR